MEHLLNPFCGENVAKKGTKYSKSSHVNNDKSKQIIIQMLFILRIVYMHRSDILL